MPVQVKFPVPRSMGPSAVFWGPRPRREGVVMTVLVVAGMAGVAMALVVMAAAGVVVVCRGAEDGSRAKAPWVARRSRPVRLGILACGWVSLGVGVVRV